MIRFVAIAALAALGGWTLLQPAAPAADARALDRLVTRMADPALGRATPDQLQAALGGVIRFDAAPGSMNAPFCAVTLPIQPDQTVADGIARFESEAADGACPVPHLRHLALRISTSPTHVVDLLQAKLGEPDEREETTEGILRVSWFGNDRAFFVEYDPKQPDAASLFLIKRPAVSAL